MDGLASPQGLGCGRVGADEAGRKGEREVNGDVVGPIDTVEGMCCCGPGGPDSMALGKSKIPHGSALRIHSTDCVSV